MPLGNPDEFPIDHGMTDYTTYFDYLDFATVFRTEYDQFIDSYGRVANLDRNRRQDTDSILASQHSLDFSPDGVFESSEKVLLLKYLENRKRPHGFTMLETYRTVLETTEEGLCYTSMRYILSPENTVDVAKSVVKNVVSRNASRGLKNSVFIHTPQADEVMISDRINRESIIDDVFCVDDEDLIDMQSILGEWQNVISSLGEVSLVYPRR